MEEELPEVAEDFFKQYLSSIRLQALNNKHPNMINLLMAASGGIDASNKVGRKIREDSSSRYLNTIL